MNGLSNKNTNISSKQGAGLLDFLESFVLAVICVVLIFLFVARLSVVDGSSMENTLHNKDYVIVFNFFDNYSPKNGDIVVIDGRFENDKSDKYEHPLVKRVIATEGQTIKIDYNNNKVYVDGEELQEDYAFFDPKMKVYLYSYMENSVGGIYEKTVPEGYLFVMGDNRYNSSDSRIPSIGFIDNNFVVGKVIFRILPFNRIGIVK